jgi:MarR family 2-MHQ and catechol resistance regulon transcriptional repressor
MPTRYCGNTREKACLNAYINLLRASDSVMGHVNRHSPALTRAGLTIGQLGVLEALFFVGPLSQTDLAAKILRTGGNMTMIIDNLEKRRLVSRTKAPGDRRTNLVTLTPAGRDLVEEFFPGHVEAIVAAMAALDAKELADLRSLCRSLGQGLATPTLSLPPVPQPSRKSPGGSFGRRQKK